MSLEVTCWMFCTPTYKFSKANMQDFDNESYGDCHISRYLVSKFTFKRCIPRWYHLIDALGFSIDIPKATIGMSTKMSLLQTNHSFMDLTKHHLTNTVEVHLKTVWKEKDSHESFPSRHSVSYLCQLKIRIRLIARQKRNWSWWKPAFNWESWDRSLNPLGHSSFGTSCDNDFLNLRSLWL